MDLLWNLEINIILFLQSLGDWLILPFQALSFLATEEFFIIIMPAIFWCFDALIGLRMAIMLVTSGALNSMLKFLFHLPRPFWFDANVKSLSIETSFGLPSGHSQNSASLWGMLAASGRKKGLWIASILIVFFIGLSRLYLGMHFLHDVLAGWLVGVILVSLYLVLERPVANWIRQKSLPFQLVVIFIFSILLIVLGLGAKSLNADWQMPSEWIETALQTGGAAPDPYNDEGLITLGGVAFGFLSGLAWWVKKFGFPKVEGLPIKRFLRYVVGIVGVIALYLGLKLIFPEDPTWLAVGLRFVRYALIGGWVTAFAPLLFRKLKLDR